MSRLHSSSSSLSGCLYFLYIFRRFSGRCDAAMPSYADEFAARHPDWQRRNNAGPVRLTISRGDSYRGPDGRLTFAEKWEQEEIMDVEVVSSVDAETDSQQLGIQSDQDLSLVDTIRERLGNGRQKGARLRAFSLLIVDT
jgi:hypothetical protein